ncbi:iron chelate uptake ABC transporter family permease subunit [Sodalis sp.]|uniref:iron chelate uptake ABC transporter family permease subunit n=1 Tax=Sodalis sp. (in: enterobacteria) TaxID=1898979 RepID=UPI003872B56D
MTTNPMDGPEVLGIDAGTTCAVILLILLIPGDAFVWQLPAGSLGSALTLGAIILVSGRRYFRRSVCCWRASLSAPRLPRSLHCC